MLYLSGTMALLHVYMPAEGHQTNGEWVQSPLWGGDWHHGRSNQNLCDPCPSRVGLFMHYPT
jgi:hypothetical protein